MLSVQVQRKRRKTRGNKLNDLSGTEWIKFTKSWFIHRPPRRQGRKLLHPASFPESLVKEFVLFFTKKRQVVVDPFLGTGSSLLACAETGRTGIGFEIVPKYAKIARERLREFRRGRLEQDIQSVVSADSRTLSSVWIKRGFPQADYCITSPPYWNQLKRNHMRQRDRIGRDLDTTYSKDPREIGNINDYEGFLIELKSIMDEVFKVLKPNGYLTLITNNVFFNGRMRPLAFDTVRTLTKEPYGWIPKDERIWCQDDKALLPLGVYSAWVGNRHHQYCLIFRKETES